MKKLTILIVSLAMLLLFSCEKLETCKTCTTKTTGGGVTSSTTFEACGQDWRDVDGKVVTSTASYGTYSVTVTSRTNCK